MIRTVRELRLLSEEINKVKKVVPTMSLFGDDLGEGLRLLIQANSLVAGAINDGIHEPIVAVYFRGYTNWLSGRIDMKRFIEILKRP